jgi:ATP-dependent helicase/nuclease subunit A
MPAATSDLAGALADRMAETRRNQAAAADPAASVWVSANAGTGKTHVLTMRMLRLLLAGTEPARILALTYTKAAAAEMATRVASRLAEWVTASDDELRQRLRELLDGEPSAAETKRARQLFALVIETPGGLKVQTIHAFCERLLQRFPLEAGVPPGFEILDDHTRAALLEEATNQVLTEATTAAPGSPLAEALATAIAFAAESNFDTYLAEALRQRDWLQAAGDDLRAHLTESLGQREWLEAAARLEHDADLRLVETEKLYRRVLGLAPDSSFAATTEKLANVLTKAQLMRLRSVLAEGSRADAGAAEQIAAALAAPGITGRIMALSKVFLTGGGERRKSLITRGLAAKYPDISDGLESAQELFVSLYEERCKVQLMEATLALLRLGSGVMQRYSEVKARHAQLDFDDLVARAANLLRRSGAVDWVLYKLDGGLDHILVDEAQDTSPVQWEVIAALADEFFSGEGVSEQPRTLFAVGDEKQSIYSFQGAAPKMFAAKGEALGTRIERAGLPWRPLPLTLSFRSVEPLLAAVDAVFARPDRTPGVGSSQVRHVAHRAGHAGLVELWPTEKHEAAASTEACSPLDETSATPAAVRLANRIADTIAGWLRSGERLASEDRPVRAGDILVLVRKRLPFAPALVSALKARGVPVAGADRLMLTEQIAVQDLMAVGDVLTLPQDDLALAAVLKSPLFSLDDTDLMALAHGREGSLWEQLQVRRQDGNSDRLARAAGTLQRWRAVAEREPPFEFYASVLDREGGRARMLARLGTEAADAIDEFLNLALAHDDGAPPSLQGFLCRLRKGQREIKRDMEQGRDEVRVMTVHGAKGLEAPIVFLPDTCSTRSARQSNSLLTLGGVELPGGLPPPFLWPVKGTSKVAEVRAAKALVDAAETEERNRLLYVALTRARDRLYVAGFEGAQRPSGNCWYNLIREGLAGLLEEATDAEGRAVWRMSIDQTIPPAPGRTRAEATADAGPLPAWAHTPAPPEPLITQPLIPSRLAPLEGTVAAGGESGGTHRKRRHVDPAVLPPAQMAEDSRFVRGNLTHALLEYLPAVPQRGWAAAAEVFLARHGTQLTGKARREVAAETLAILQDPALATLFGPDSRAEVPIAAEFADPDGTGPALRLTGKIDRLVKTSGSVLILDYKTNRPPPDKPESVADAYLFQLAAYRLGVGRIFPDMKIEAAILWTDGPRLMKIPGDLLDSYQSRLWEQAPQ